MVTRSERRLRALTMKLLSLVVHAEVVWMETTAASFLILLLGHAIVWSTKPKSNQYYAHLRQHRCQIEPVCDDDMRKAARECQKVANWASLTEFNAYMDCQWPILPSWIYSWPKTYICMIVTRSERHQRALLTKSLVALVEVIVWMENTAASFLFLLLRDAIFYITKTKTNHCHTNVCQHRRQIEPNCDDDIRKASRKCQKVKVANWALLTGFNVIKDYQWPILPSWVCRVDSCRAQTCICMTARLFKCEQEQLSRQSRRCQNHKPLVIQ